VLKIAGPCLHRPILHVFCRRNPDDCAKGGVKGLNRDSPLTAGNAILIRLSGQNEGESTMKNLARLFLLLPLTGCSSVTHELQPHRLWRWNYQEAPSRTDDALFSIDDPLIPPIPSEPSTAVRHRTSGNNE